MVVITISVNGSDYSYNATDGDVAGLGAARSKVMSALAPGEGQTDATPISERPGYIADDTAWLQSVVQSWATRENADAAAIQACLARCLTSWSTDAPPAEPPAEPLSPEAQMAALLAYAADKRWRVEISGTTWNGHGVHTDRESQTKLLAAFVQLGAGLRTDPSPWKLMDGFISLTNAQMSEVITAALTHVETAYAKEAAVIPQIIDGTITTTTQIDGAFA